MITAPLSDFFRRLTRGMAAHAMAEQSDQRLVESALAGHEAAFQAIVHRHGPMVFRVCWRVLQHSQDAEDTFQATFLILAQRLRSLRKHDSLASWLHGVAHRAALKAKAKSGLRQCRELRALRPESTLGDDVTWREIRSALDVELGQLPDKWRLPLILCYLEGRTQDESARQLGWSKSTFKRRLEEARAGLGRRLNRRGLVMPVALSAVLLSDCIVSASLTLVAATVEAGLRVVSGQALTTCGVSAAVIALAKAELLLNPKRILLMLGLMVLTGTIAIGAAVWEQVSHERRSAGQRSAPHIAQHGKSKRTLEESADLDPSRLEKLRENKLESLLADLKARCRRMRSLQLGVLSNDVDGTKERFRALRENMLEISNLAGSHACSPLAAREQQIILEMNRTLDVLRGEGFGLAFPVVFEQVREDMKQVQRRLEAADVGLITQRLEKDIIDSLDEMIVHSFWIYHPVEASVSSMLAHKQADRQLADSSLPQRIGELKMIRAMQARLNNRTEMYAHWFPDEEQPADPNLRREILELRERQARILDITTKIVRGDTR